MIRKDWRICDQISQAVADLDKTLKLLDEMLKIF